MAPNFGELSEQAALGKKLSGEFLGEKFLDNVLANMKDDIFTKTSMEYIWETCFAAYARPGLEWKERSLMNIAMLIALGRGPELRIHIRAAVNNGFSEEKVCEAIRHAMIYCGVPAGRDAMIIASEVFAELKASGEYPKKA
ncbi:uncharacterized protein Z520_05138 [Fonsecaea multimorphosa CBS 102226]|uniref:Carboxymuconolactone decarboxylase-like domain-containing protein n=1 Tax=Fonsecaea multimorphosa CBS 102226 TaxID=1442371 RepID=A0A0D2K174_9EURO|nr:uncharacterized protein Z520_05138 [Fonsecaea multimorphosa CBS 102226]KIX99562.1 hypothetical protein Z520_05138 [Fonsecaea multimorphosa CBS 102226]OAL25553.1 hypothetical protein AYO22_04872 [Fonsecaea multimorphosa]